MVDMLPVTGHIATAYFLTSFVQNNFNFEMPLGPSYTDAFSNHSVFISLCFKIDPLCPSGFHIQMFAFSWSSSSFPCEQEEVKTARSPCIKYMQYRLRVCSIVQAEGSSLFCIPQPVLHTLSLYSTYFIWGWRYNCIFKWKSITDKSFNDIRHWEYGYTSSP